MPRLTPSTAAKIDAVLKDATSGDNPKLPPYWFHVADKDSVLYSGQAGSYPDGRPVDDKTVVSLYSMTKFLTSISILQLIDRGLVTLETPASDVIAPLLTSPKILTGYDAKTDEPVFVDAKTPITILHLLNHTSGLAYGAAPNHAHLARYYTETGHGVVSMMGFNRSFLATQVLIYEPGTSFSYGPSTDFLGKVVEKLSGLSLGDYFQKNIFEPIGLAQNSFSFTLRPDLAERHLPCTFRHPATRVLSPLPAGVPILALDPAKVTDHWGGMGLHGTLREYLDVIQAILVQKDNKLLSEKSWDLLWKPTLKEGDQPLEELAIFRPKPIGTGDVQVGAGGLFLNITDWPGRRKAISGYWGGYLSTAFFIDPVTGIVASGGTQLLPGSDAEHEEVWGKLESLLYEGLEAAA